MTVPQNSQAIINITEKETIKPLLAWYQAQWRGILSEFVSTAMLLMFGCMSCIPIKGLPINPVLYAPIGFGLVVMFNIQIFGHISGAFMNPFVTIIAVIWQRISIATGVAYIIAECIGAILGYGFLIAVSPVDVVTEGICLTLPNREINAIQALAVEIMLTAALSLINCSVWDPINRHNIDSLPQKFGFTIIALGIAGGPLSGASMNPARSLGPALWTGRWDVHWVYWVGPLVGGILSAVFYRVIWLQKHENKDES